MFGSAASLAVGGSLMADLTDEHELETGQRRAGVFFGVIAFASKATPAIGIWLAGAILQWIGFPTGAAPGEVPTNVIRQLGWTYGPGVFVLVILAGTTLTGFWEEFLFRGLVQERLRVLGPRLSLLLTALMFALIHVNKGPWPVLIAFGIGLAFCVARDRIGIWPLVFIHATIDFTSDVFVRRWEGFGLFGAAVVGAYGLVALFVLSRRSQKTE